MSLRLATIVLDVADMKRASTFWTAALGYRETSVTDEWISLAPPGGGVAIGLQPRADAKGDPNRVHIDIAADDVAAEVRRLEGLGATRAVWPYYPKDANWVVMLDPDGNEFCIVPG